MMTRLLMVMLALAGCTENRQTLFIRQMQVLDSECIASADTGGTFYSSGTLDLGIRREYSLFPLMENQMVGREDPTSVRVESNGVQVDGAIVNLYETNNEGIPPEDTEPVLRFFSYAASYVPPESTGVVGLTVIPPEYANDKVGTIDVGESELLLVGVQVTGITNGGLPVEAAEFFFPVFLCQGCLVTCPDGCTGDPAEDPPCSPGQDEAVDCRRCQNSSIGCCSG